MVSEHGLCLIGAWLVCEVIASEGFYLSEWGIGSLFLLESRFRSLYLPSKQS